MPNQATSADVENRWRPLTTAEAAVAATLLDDVWRMIKRRIPDVDDRMADATTGADYTADVIMVQANAVKRVLVNPDGKRAESIDDYSWTRDRALSSGLLYLTDEEWALLDESVATSGGAFTIDTTPTEFAGTTIYPVSVTGLDDEHDWT